MSHPKDLRRFLSLIWYKPTYHSPLIHLVVPYESLDQIEKNVFLVFYSGERSKAKILKICEAFGANRYPFAEESGKHDQMIAEDSQS
ncbi:hypothetical protein K1719_045287 [Acacia pycnantha]|nr:hypothetical protein K1719_045287 [Acacia pycnantha]